MKVEKTDKEIIIRIPNSIDIERAQRIIDYIRYLENTSNSKATQQDVDKHASDVNREWWEKNKDTLSYIVVRRQSLNQRIKINRI